MDLTTGELEKIDYEPLLNPRYSSAITVVGDELYILGGRGNKYGKQELVSHFYTELCAIDLKKEKVACGMEEATDRCLYANGFIYVFRTLG